MTTPSLHTTFDASLIDLQRSFSSTETASSTGKENMPPPDTRTRVYANASTTDLYAKWADTYDTDGNFLQSVDDLQMTEILPKLAELVPKECNKPLRILDLGCGTGRTTLKLLQYPWNRPVRIEAWDNSEEMLDVARHKCKDHNVGFRQVNITEEDNHVNATLDLIVSTLVLEHTPLRGFFDAISWLLAPEGIAFVSNMHPDMGSGSVAGFDDGQGRRVVGTSHVHGIAETVAAAREVEENAFYPLELVGDVKEVAVTQEMLDSGSVGERGRKWLGTKVWFGLVLQKD